MPDSLGQTKTPSPPCPSLCPHSVRLLSPWLWRHFITDAAGSNGEEGCPRCHGATVLLGGVHTHTHTHTHIQNLMDCRAPQPPRFTHQPQQERVLYIVASCFWLNVMQLCSVRGQEGHVHQHSLLFVHYIAAVWCSLLIVWSRYLHSYLIQHTLFSPQGAI